VPWQSQNPALLVQTHHLLLRIAADGRGQSLCLTMGPFLRVFQLWPLIFFVVGVKLTTAPPRSKDGPDGVQLSTAQRRAHVRMTSLRVAKRRTNGQACLLAKPREDLVRNRFG
jgi:hypothetical protein